MIKNLLQVSAGTMLTSMIASGFLLGYLADRWLATRPWLMLVFGCLGIIGGFLKAYNLLSRSG